MLGDRERVGYFYILASKKKGTVYKGVTSNLLRRIAEHKAGKGSVFTARYSVHSLVYYERIFDAIEREKRVKEWKRAWTVVLIETMNPTWRDLYEDVQKL